jgi:phosphoribosylformylglycinamidine (FGAM) synthase PurS component
MDGDNEMVQEVIDAARKGAHGIARLRTEKYYTLNVDGEEVLLDDTLRAAAEAALGEPLVEKVFPGFAGQVNLVPRSMAA